MHALSFALLCFSWCAVAQAAQYAPRHVPPSDTTVPMGARLEAQVIGQGVQIYTCSRKNGPLAWSFKAPDANLLDPATHEQVGTHSEGPTWRWKDGSAVTGEVVVTQAALEAGSVPWLLLKASPLGKQEGLLSNIVWVRRSETHGGAQPVSGCDDLHLGKSKEIPYTALYTFYSIGTPAGQPR